MRTAARRTSNGPRRWPGGFVLATLVSGLVALGCRVNAPPPPELLALLGARPDVRHEKVQARVRIESEQLTGTFQAALARRRGSAPVVRLKLFSDLGGAVLDLAASAEAVRAHFPQAGITLDWSREEGESLRRGLLAFFAASVLEEAAPITYGRIRGARHLPEGWWLELEPVLEDVRVTASLNARGDVLGRTYELRRARWTEGRGATVRYEGQGFSLVIDDIRVVEVPELSDELFHLSLPASSAP